MYMVYDTASGDILFHETKEKAEIDYKEAIQGLEDGDLLGEHSIYLFKVEKSQTLTFYPED